MASCRTCGVPLEADNACTACFLSLGLLADPQEHAPEFGSIDRYVLLQKIGEGGMGEVWLAEQTEALQRSVAIKVLKSGVSSREVVARFESERQALALMDHPSIARVFDAGTTTRGAPFFAMEFVDGVPITEYADRHRLVVLQRLELFLLVCHAVQHAHQKAIIHRDLKPSNILVTETDGRATPKVIDFGIAKALTRKLALDTLHTRVGAFIGTPEYMSPEQASSMGQDIDTRTDVYSLGVVFYELLTGTLPLDGRDLPFDEFLRRLREDDVRRPSTSVKGGYVQPTQLHGDLDSIALKALEKDRSRRYGSPADFAADIDRYLNNHPVLAMPPSAVYRARKFARRYRLALATAAAFILVLIGATVVSVRASLHANREAAAAQAVNDFLQNDLLAQASTSNQIKPNAGGSSEGARTGRPDPDLKVRTALDRAAARITGKFDKQPEIEAAIRDTMGQSYMDLGLFREARTQLERAVDLHQRVLGEADLKTAKSMSRLGSSESFLGQYPEAAKALSRALDTQRRLLGPEHPETLHTISGLASCYRSQGKYAQAAMLQSQALESSRRVLGPEHPETLRAMNSLGNLYSAMGKYKEAEMLDGQILEVRRRLFGAEYPATLYATTNLAEDYRAEGRYSDAENLLTRTVEIEREIMGTKNSATLHSMNILANVWYMQGKYAQAEALHEETLQNMRVARGPEHLDSLWVSANLACDYYLQSKFARAETLLTETAATENRVLASDHPATLYTISALAGLYQRWGKYDLAERYAVQALAGRRRVLGVEHPDTMQSVTDLAFVYLSERKYDRSEPLAREAVEFARRIEPDGWRLFRDTAILGASMAGQAKYAEAEPMLAEGLRGLTARKKQIPAPDGHFIEATLDQIDRLSRLHGREP